MNIEGFTARTMDGEDDRKYINSSDSDIYHKSRSIFGIDQALPAARRQEKLFLVEGGPDVIKLQSVGILNTIASLGGAWTRDQFERLRDYRMQNITLCFIPDSDVPKAGEKLGAGFKNVLKNGALGRIHQPRHRPDGTHREGIPALVSGKIPRQGSNHRGEAKGHQQCVRPPGVHQG